MTVNGFREQALFEIVDCDSDGFIIDMKVPLLHQYLQTLELVPTTNVGTQINYSSIFACLL